MPTYGIWQEKDLALDALAAEVDRDAILEAQLETVASHNIEVASTVSIFANIVTIPQLVVRTGSGAARLQPLDENGRPKPIKGQGQYYVGFPLYKAGVAEGYNFWTREQMTVQDFADSLDLMLRADATWVRDQMLSALFYSGAGFTYEDPRLGESFTVYGLANGDTVVYDKTSGAATDSHYSAEADAISASNNLFPAIYEDLSEHPGNSGRIVAFVPPAAASAISLLPGYAPVQQNTIRIVPAVDDGDIDPLVSPSLNLRLPRTMQHIGMLNNTYIVTWQNLPAGYIVHVAVDAVEKPLAAREYAQPRLRGLMNEGEPMSRFPYQQNNWVRALGFGGRNRVAAHVYYYGTSDTYAAPSAYPFPLA
jgi:hypothetical protein